MSNELDLAAVVVVHGAEGSDPHAVVEGSGLRAGSVVTEEFEVASSSSALRMTMRATTAGSLRRCPCNSIHPCCRSPKRDLSEEKEVLGVHTRRVARSSGVRLRETHSPGS